MDYYDPNSDEYWMKKLVQLPPIGFGKPIIKPLAAGVLEKDMDEVLVRSHRRALLQPGDPDQGGPHEDEVRVEGTAVDGVFEGVDVFNIEIKDGLIASFLAAAGGGDDFDLQFWKSMFGPDVNNPSRFLSIEAPYLFFGFPLRAQGQGLPGESGQSGGGGAHSNRRDTHSIYLIDSRRWRSVALWVSRRGLRGWFQAGQYPCARASPPPPFQLLPRLPPRPPGPIPRNFSRNRHFPPNSLDGSPTGLISGGP